MDVVGSVVLVLVFVLVLVVTAVGVMVPELVVVVAVLEADGTVGEVHGVPVGGSVATTAHSELSSTQVVAYDPALALLHAPSHATLIAASSEQSRPAAQKYSTSLKVVHGKQTNRGSRISTGS